MLPRLPFALIFSLCFLAPTIQAEPHFGACIEDPNAAALQTKWQHYQDLRAKRAQINLKAVVKELRMDLETMKVLQAVSEIEPLMNLVDQIEARYLKKAFVDKHFNSMVSDEDFVERLEKRELDAEIAASDLSFKSDPGFLELFEQIRAEVARSEVKEALAVFRSLDLGILEGPYRKSAKLALKMIRKKCSTQEIVRSWIHDPPYLRNVPYPPASIGAFAIRYRQLVQKSIAEFVVNRTVSIEEAKRQFPKIRDAEVAEMNSIEPPTERNAFDDHILKHALETPGIAEAENLNPSQFAAVDGVTRTLWGEASSCQLKGLSQFEAISKIIADRSLAVCRAIDEEQLVKEKASHVKEKNWLRFLKNWVGIRRPAPGMEAAPVNPYRGLSDFGRREKIELPCAAQVVSRKNQFSVWNSYRIKRYHTGRLHPNLPDSIYEIQGPQGSQDDQALVRILCPKLETPAQIAAWEHAETLARTLVLDPAKISSTMSWPVKDSILFYTHEAALPFAREVRIPHLRVNGKRHILRRGSSGACNGFRLFSPSVKTRY